MTGATFVSGLLLWAAQTEAPPPQVMIEAHVYSISCSELGRWMTIFKGSEAINGGVSLTDAQAEQIHASANGDSRVHLPKLTILSGKKGTLRIVTEKYLHQVRFHWTGSEFTYVPVPKKHPHGISLEFSPIVKPDENWIRCNMKLTNHVAEQLNHTMKGGLAVPQPHIVTHEFFESFDIKSGEWALFNTWVQTSEKEEDWRYGFVLVKLETLGSHAAKRRFDADPATGREPVKFEENIDLKRFSYFPNFDGKGGPLWEKANDHSYDHFNIWWSFNGFPR